MALQAKLMIVGCCFEDMALKFLPFLESLVCAGRIVVRVRFSTLFCELIVESGNTSVLHIYNILSKCDRWKEVVP